MSNKKRRTIIVGVISFFCIIIIVLLIVIEQMKTSPDIYTLIQNVMLSILCSIVASFIFMYIQMGIEQDESDTIMEKLNHIDQKLKIQESLYDSGIKSVRKKSYYDKKDNFWNNMIRLTENRLDLTGHSISNWFSSEYKEVFCAKIKNMINEERYVRIVLSCNDKDLILSKIQDIVEGKGQLKTFSKIERTCYELAILLKNIDSKKQKYLEVYVTDIKDVTYLYIRTDEQCFISPYIFNSKNSGDTFLLELETGVEYSRCFEEDFDEMIRNLDCVNLVKKGP